MMTVQYRAVLRDMAKLWVAAGGTSENIRDALIDFEQYVSEEKQQSEQEVK